MAALFDIWKLILNYYWRSDPLFHTQPEYAGICINEMLHLILISRVKNKVYLHQEQKIVRSFNEPVKDYLRNIISFYLMFSQTI